MATDEEPTRVPFAEQKTKVCKLSFQGAVLLQKGCFRSRVAYNGERHAGESHAFSLRFNTVFRRFLPVTVGSHLCFRKECVSVVMVTGVGATLLPA